MESKLLELQTEFGKGMPEYTVGRLFRRPSKADVIRRVLFFRLFRRSRSVYRLRRYQFTRDNRLLGGVAACDNAHYSGLVPRAQECQNNKRLLNS